MALIRKNYKLKLKETLLNLIYTEKVRQAETPEEELTLIKKELETLKNQ